MRKVPIGAGIIVMMMCARYTSADDRMTVGEFYTSCKSAPSSTSGAFCAGYMLGYADLLVVIGRSKEVFGDNYRFGICNTSYTSDALRFLFINWAEKHPKDWTEDFAFGVDHSLREAWPCD